MARMRTIKPEASTSESLSGIPRAVRWTFATLWTHCDDEGRAVNNARLIKAAIYPLDDDMTPEVVAGELADLERIGALCFYETDGKQYLHVPSWHGNQKPNHPVASKLPPCPKTDHSRTDTGGVPEAAVNPHVDVPPVVVVVVGDGVVGEKEVEARPARTAPKRGTRLPDDWRPTDATRTWTLERLTKQAAATELEKFRNHWLSKTGKDATKLDWDRTWRNWVLNSRPANGRASPGESTADQRVNQGLALAAELRADERKELTG